MMNILSSLNDLVLFFAIIVLIITGFDVFLRTFKFFNNILARFLWLMGSAFAAVFAIFLFPLIYFIHPKRYNIVSKMNTFSAFAYIYVISGFTQYITDFSSMTNCELIALMTFDILLFLLPYSLIIGFIVNFIYSIQKLYHPITMIVLDAIGVIGFAVVKFYTHSEFLIDWYTANLAQAIVSCFSLNAFFPKQCFTCNTEVLFIMLIVSATYGYFINRDVSVEDFSITKHIRITQISINPTPLTIILAAISYIVILIPIVLFVHAMNMIDVFTGATEYRTFNDILSEKAAIFNNIFKPTTTQ